MALEDFKADALRCTRCSYCKWIPFDLVRSHEFAKGCPSVDYNHFHSYSAGGRLITMLSLMQDRSQVDDDVVDIAFKCQLCGNCDVACKVCRYDMEPLAALREFRHVLNQQGQVPAAYPGMIAKLRESRNFGGRPQTDRPKWAEGLGLKEWGAGGAAPAPVLFHAGCRYSFDPSLRSAVRAAATVFIKGGVDFAIDPGEGCCAGKAYDMGYRDDCANAARANLQRWAAAGVKTVVTPCATCYYTFKRLYPEAGTDAPVPEILHTVQLADRLLKDGSLKPAKQVPVSVTYHDPCHLGRQGEEYVALERQGGQDLRPGGGLRPAAASLQRRLWRVRSSARRAPGHPRSRTGGDGTQPRSRLVLRGRGRRTRDLSRVQRLDRRQARRGGREHRRPHARYRLLRMQEEPRRSRFGQQHRT